MEGLNIKFGRSLIWDGIRFIPAFRLNKGYTRLNYLHLDVTSKCNLKCKMCEWRYKVGRREMPWEIYKKAIDEGKKLGLKKIVIAATGESLMHPHFPNLINYALDHKLDIELVTNLTITDKHLDAILKVKKLVVSLDGATKETYEKIRVGANFERTINNFRYILKNKKDTYVQINYVIQKDNFLEVDKMADLLAELGGINEVSFKFPNNEMKEVYESTKLSGEDIKIAELKLKIATEKLKKRNIKTNLDSAPFEFSKTWIHEIPCYNLWFGAFVNPDGLVMPCCDFYRDKDSLGDLKVKSMKEIWNSKKYNEIRRRFKGRKPKICEGCPGDNRRYHNLLLKIPFHKFLLGI